MNIQYVIEEVIEGGGFFFAKKQITQMNNLSKRSSPYIAWSNYLENEIFCLDFNNISWFYGTNGVFIDRTLNGSRAYLMLLI